MTRLVIDAAAPRWAHDLVEQLDRAANGVRVSLVAMADLPPPARSQGRIYGRRDDGRLVYSDGAIWRYVGTDLPA